MRLRLGLWMRIAIVASVFWLIIGYWGIYREILSVATRSFARDGASCQKLGAAFSTCFDQALARYQGYWDNIWWLAAGRTLLVLLIAWALGLIAVLGVRWALAGRTPAISSNDDRTGRPSL